jgi:hypothetical protein
VEKEKGEKKKCEGWRSCDLPNNFDRDHCYNKNNYPNIPKSHTLHTIKAWYWTSKEGIGGC